MAPDSPKKAPIPGAAARRRRRTTALGASLLIHGALFLAFTSSATGGLVSGATGGGPHGPVFDVVLVGPVKRSAPDEASSAETLQPLFAKLKVAPDEYPIPFVETARKDGFAALTARLTVHEAPAPPKSRPPQPGRDQVDEAPREAAEAASPKASGGTAEARLTRGPAGSAISTGSLWGRLEPCWRDVSSDVRVTVRLELEFDRVGRLASPPKIIRAQSATVDEPRLRAEAKALAALAACLPRGDVRYAGSVQQIEFVAGS